MRPRKSERMMKTQGYCVKCKSKCEMAGAVEQVLKNGRKAIKGKCPACGTGMFKMLGKTAPEKKTEAAPQAPEPSAGGWTLLG